MIVSQTRGGRIGPVTTSLLVLTVVVNVYAQLVGLFSDLNSYQSWFDQTFIDTGKTR